MKIIHIISSGGMYGAEAVILNLSHVLNERGHSSILGVFSNSANPNLQLYEAALQQNLEAYLIDCAGQIDRGVISRIRELVEQTGADLVHSHGYKADIYCYLALRNKTVSLVSTCHTWYDNNLFVTFYGIADRLVLRGYDGVVGVSDEVIDRLVKAGITKNKIYSIKNGIDLRPFTNAKPSLRNITALEGSSIVGLIGRLSIEKGVDLYLHACARVRQELASSKFVIVGDGPDKDKLEALIDELGLRSSVLMLGRRDDMPSVYASLDVMVSASRQEGLPIALLEGMASKCPIVATSVGEIPALILNDQTGIMVKPGDVEAIAAAIVRLLKDASERARLGAAARRHVEDGFSAQRMADDYLRVYESCLMKRETPQRYPQGVSK